MPAKYTGNSVSFFYQLDPATITDIAPEKILLSQPASARYQQGGINLVLQAEYPGLMPVARASVPELAIAATVTIFGQTLNWPFICQVLQQLQHGAKWLQLQCIQPHPELPVALRISLPVELTAEQLQSLQQLATAQAYEMVYLLSAPQLSQPGLLVMDMDSTAIQIECIDEIAKLAGTGEQVAAITARAMNGELDFAQSLTERVATLKGAPKSVLRQVLDKLPLMPGLTELVAHLQHHNWQVAIASGGFTYFTEALKQRLALTATFANQLDIADGVLTGLVKGAIVDAQSKAQVVTELARQYHIAAGQTVAIGDGANDLPMLKTAALGVAFHAKPKVQAEAKAAIKQGSLLQLLYLLV